MKRSDKDASDSRIAKHQTAKTDDHNIRKTEPQILESNDHRTESSVTESKSAQRISEIFGKKLGQHQAVPSDTAVGKSDENKPSITQPTTASALTEYINKKKTGSSKPVLQTGSVPPSILSKTDEHSQKFFTPANGTSHNITSDHPASVEVKKATDNGLKTPVKNEQLNTEANADLWNRIGTLVSASEVKSRTNGSSMNTTGFMDRKIPTNNTPKGNTTAEETLFGKIVKKQTAANSISDDILNEKSGKPVDDQFNNTETGVKSEAESNSTASMEHQGLNGDFTPLSISPLEEYRNEHPESLRNKGNSVKNSPFLRDLFDTSLDDIMRSRSYEPDKYPADEKYSNELSGQENNNTVNHDNSFHAAGSRFINNRDADDNLTFQTDEEDSSYSAYYLENAEDANNPAKPDVPYRTDRTDRTDSIDYRNEPEDLEETYQAAHTDDSDDIGGTGDMDDEDRQDFTESQEEVKAKRHVAVQLALGVVKGLKWVLIYMGRFVTTVLKTALVLILVVGFGVLGAGVGAIYGYIEDVEPITSEILEIKIQTSYIYDDSGNVLVALTGSQNMNRELVFYEDISPYLPKAFIAIEDERFESHNGIDLKRIIGAGIGFFTSAGDSYGGSTITQQLVKNITGKKQETLERKVQEWYLAVQLENEMEKWKILEKYMNVIYMGHSCSGVRSASTLYFGKDVRNLTLAESAFLAGITNSPGKYDPYTEAGRIRCHGRKELILSQMLKLAMISQSEYEDAMDETIIIRPKKANEASNSKPQTYFVDHVINEVKNDLMAEFNITEATASEQIYNHGLRIYTTQSSSIQSVMDEVFNDEKYFPTINPDAIANNEQPQGAMVILDPYTSQIKALYGGFGEKQGSNLFNRATQARRQPGSSIKPIAVYGPAVDQKVVTPASVIDDTPAHLDPNSPERIYPKNSGNSFTGLTTIRNAIRRSINVVAAKVWTRIPDISLEYLKRVGLDRDNERNVALALGGLNRGVTTLEMAAAYAPFVNRGMYYPPTSYTRVEDSNGNVLLDKSSKLPTIVYSEQTAFLMNSMLQEVLKPGGTGVRAALRDGSMPAAGKTGTTNDDADRWFVGYTPYYVAATWYGYDNRIKKIYLTSDELGNPMTIWRTIMEKVHEGLEPKEFTMPPQIVSASVCIYSGKAPRSGCSTDPRGNAVRTEYFVKNTEPRHDDLCDVHSTVSICAEGTEILGFNVLHSMYCPIESEEPTLIIKRSVPYIPLKGDPYPADWSYEYSGFPVCSYHTEFGINPAYLPEDLQEPEDTDPDDPDNPDSIIGNTSSGQEDSIADTAPVRNRRTSTSTQPQNNNQETAQTEDQIRSPDQIF